ncbi:MAG: glycogen/starch/alpha-glucan phosphorylase [Alkaliphilus sp.]
MDNLVFKKRCKEEVKDAIVLKLQNMFGRTLKMASKGQIYKAVAMTLRDDMMGKWAYSKEMATEENGRTLYYLSMEFLVGRMLGKNLINLSEEEEFFQACDELGIDLTEIRNIEPNAGLGNGGLGRLAACFLDSISSLGLPGHGNGIRYEYGLFEQKIIDGYQIEAPDPWLEDGNVWEVAKHEEPEIIYFGGTVETRMINGVAKYIQRNCHTVKAIPYDMAVTGYKTPVVNTLRLWGARALKPMDMALFGQGQYVDAIAEKELAESISKVLYPEDNHEEGKSLRLKQQYFFVSASIKSIVRKYKKTNAQIEDFAKKSVIHVNDTHPALGIPELMRILMDQEGLSWDVAWDITKNTFAYTNHTVLQEALEKWPIDLLQKLLPRIYDIIHEINERFCKTLWDRYSGEWDKIAQMAIISHGEVRMSNLCIVGAFSVNGVAALHTQILKDDVFKDFYQMYPEKFVSITNGVDHRRFLYKSNKRLAKLLTDNIGDEWITDASKLKKFAKFAKDSSVQEELRKLREHKKESLAKYIFEKNGIKVDPKSIFDVQIKRLHEYKRQFMNVLHIMYLYNKIKEDPNFTMHPRTFIFGAKAAPGYHNAKMIIKLIHTVGDKINNDSTIKDKLKVVFIENYKVSLAEKIIPATDISEQISTAGKEASGTGNMKFMMNGALTVGTLDGANVEIKEAVGDDNIFIFGLTAEETDAYYKGGHYKPLEIYARHKEIKTVVEQLVNGFYTGENSELFRGLHDGLLYGHGGMADPYFVLKDFESYYVTQARIGQLYKNPSAWWEKSIYNIAYSGVFSSDRTIKDYSDKIWKLNKHGFAK